MTAPPTPLFPSLTTTTTSSYDDDFSIYYSFFQDPVDVPADAPAPPAAAAVGCCSSSSTVMPNRKRGRDEEERTAAKKQTSPSVSPQSSSEGYDDEDVGFGTSLLEAELAAAMASVSSPSSSSAGNGRQQGGSQRRLWVKDRSSDWWDQYSRPELPEEEFRRAFRMSRATFDFICEELGSTVAKEDTTLRAAIPVRKRVAVCIWRLATGEPLRLVSRRFGLGISTCHKLVLEVCTAIRSVLMSKALLWPSPAAAADAARRFEAASGIANVVGAMYTTHIPIIAPKVNVSAYFNPRHTDRNQKSSYSITLQGIVDPDGVFTDVCIGWPGAMPDDQVLEKSAFYQRASGGLLGNHQWVVGGAGYPLTDWMLVPYTQKNLTWTQHAFNEKVGEVQRVAKEAFRRLKERWGCLQKRTEVKLQDLPVVLGACCVLHNICELRKEQSDSELRYELFDDEMVAENNVRSARASQVRDTIAHNLLHGGFGAVSFLP